MLGEDLEKVKKLLTPLTVTADFFNTVVVMNYDGEGLPDNFKALTKKLNKNFGLFTYDANIPESDIQQIIFSNKQLSKAQVNLAVYLNDNNFL